MNAEKTVENIRRELGNYLANYPNLKSLVIGVSGGIDSTVCCAIARPVCDEHGVKLIGRSMPIITNEKEEIDRARLTGKAFCHDFEELVLDDVFLFIRTKILEQNGIDEFATEADENRAKIRMGNVKARTRMIYLYDIAAKENGLVLSTDNLTEFLLGFWTLHGDVGDLGMIQNAWKTEVYEIASYLASEYIQGKSYEPRADALEQGVKAKATDGLGVADGDLDQFGADSWQNVDGPLKEYLSDEVPLAKLSELEKNPVVRRHIDSQFKRDNPFNFSRNVVAD